MIKHLLFCLLLLASFVTCTDYGSDREISRMDVIKQLGNSHPQLALASYDSLKDEFTKGSTYVRNKYTLLGIRLRDKAKLPHTSDSCIRRLVPYFEKKGTIREMQEVYYYAGSVYRDLQDTPRSLEYFLKSAACTEKGETDSVMLRNCYSQLCAMYTKVQDYGNALQMAKAEYEVARSIGTLDGITMIQLGNAYMRTDSFPQATEVMRMMLTENDTTNLTPDILCDLLYYFSLTDDTANARFCYTRFVDMPERHPIKAQQHISLGKYFLLLGLTDSSAQHYQLALEQGDSICKYDACRKLFHLYEDCGEKEEAYKYASEFLRISTCLDLGMRQEQAATINNQYQYYKDKQEEDSIKAEKEIMELYLWMTLLITLTLISVICAVYTFRKYQRQRLLHEISMTLDGDTGSDNGNEQETHVLMRIKKGMDSARIKQEEMAKNLEKAEGNIKEQEQSIERAKRDAEEKLQEAHRQMERGVNLFKMAHLTELSKNDNDIVESIRKASRMEQELTSKQWSELISFINDRYPTFSQKIVTIHGPISEKQMHICYLLKMGFTNTEICNIMKDCSRSTIWRWKNRLKAI
ncbi:MAG: hypothetical protein PUF00_02645 [Paraprevotella sp.]|nr:hypothetical protein [Paraprevotella sp.]MDD6823950.1 hypothetical protein [Paraprevotella sp.]